MKRRVVVTGMGVVTPLSLQVDDLFRRLCAGESGVRPIKGFDTAQHKIHFGGEVQDFNPDERYLAPKDDKRLDRFTIFAIVAATDALRESGLDFEKEDRWRCGAIVASGIGGLWELEMQVTKLVEKGPGRVSPMTVPKMMLNAAGGNIAIKHGLKGPNYSVATACASAANAMGCALRAIQYDEAEVMVTGGSEAAITQIGVAGFANMHALSTRNDAPAKASRPFDKDRDGFVIAEGCGILIFEELEHAKKRGAKIYAEVLGFGTTCDAGHITQPDEQGAGASRAMSLALRDAKISPSDVGYINAHGTSTPLGDAAETAAVKSAFGDAARKVSISSTKSQLGHSLGASGGIELVVAVKALTDSVIPPTINLDTPDPACDLDYTPNQPRERSLNVAMSNSFGFGGHNASIIVGKVR